MFLFDGGSPLANTHPDTAHHSETARKSTAVKGGRSCITILTVLLRRNMISES